MRVDFLVNFRPSLKKGKLFIPVLFYRACAGVSTIIFIVSPPFVRTFFGKINFKGGILPFENSVQRGSPPNRRFSFAKQKFRPMADLTGRQSMR